MLPLIYMILLSVGIVYAEPQPVQCRMGLLQVISNTSAFSDVIQHSGKFFNNLGDY